MNNPTNNSRSDSQDADTSRVLDEISRSTAAAKPRRASRNGVWSVLMSLLLIPTIAALVWLAMQQRDLSNTLVSLQQDHQQLADALSESEQALDVFRRTTTEQLSEQQSERLTRQSLADESSIERLRSQFTRDVEQLNSEVASLQRQLAAVQNRDVHLRYTEVDYLLRLANRKLMLEADVTSALVLVNDADAILAQVDSTMGNTLRSRLAEDIRALRAVSLPQTGDIHTRLAELISDVQALTVIDTYRDARQNRVSASPDQSDEQTGYLAVVLDVLQNIFVLRQWREPPAEQFSPQREALVKNSLRLQLEQAQLALLLGDGALFIASLQSGRDLLDQHFADGAAAVQEIQRELDALSQIQLRPELPDLTSTLTIARQLSGAPGI